MSNKTVKVAIVYSIRDLSQISPDVEFDMVITRRIPCLPIPIRAETWGDIVTLEYNQDDLMYMLVDLLVRAISNNCD